MDTTFEVPLDALEPWNPFNNIVWHFDIDEPITIEEVEEAVEHEVTHPTPIKHREFLEDPSPRGREDHIARIAWFVMHGWDDAIELDVGVPALGCHVGWIIQDGNHRLAAAIVRREDTITATICGDWEHARELLGDCVRFTFPS
jgi:hypothetical protein